jgi:hypothetical protein
MPRPRQIRKAKKTRDDISFPVPFAQQGKYLEIADRFLGEDPPPDSANVVPIDKESLPNSRWKKAS